MKAELEAARDEQKAREEAHRRKLEEIQQRKQRAGRGAPLLTGIVRVRGSRIWVETDKAEALDLRSLRFRLADYANRQVRIWGTREERDSGGDRIEVDSIEIVGTEGR